MILQVNGDDTVTVGETWCSESEEMLSESESDDSRGVARIFQRGGGVTLCQTLSSWRYRHGKL